MRSVLARCEQMDVELQLLNTKETDQNDVDTSHVDQTLLRLHWFLTRVAIVGNALPTAELHLERVESLLRRVPTHVMRCNYVRSAHRRLISQKIIESLRTK